MAVKDFTYEKKAENLLIETGNWLTDMVIG